MPPKSMGRELWTGSPLWIIVLLSFLTSTCALDPSAELWAVVPPCAQRCLLSFIVANYARSTCGPAPSLQCLCSHVGPSGFTIGEGALECITAEKAIDGCSEEQANDSVMYRAYEMCQGQTDAVQPEHQVLTATLIILPSGDVVSFASVASTSTLALTTAASATLTSTLASNTTRITSLVLDTSSPPPIPSDIATTLSSSYLPVSSIIKTTSPSTESTAIGGATTSSGQRRARKSSGVLGKAKIAGISVGAFAAASAVVAVLFLARLCWRRRTSRKSGFLQLQDSWPGRTSVKERRREGDSWIARQIRAPITVQPPPPPPPKSPPANSYRNWNREGVRPALTGSPSTFRSPDVSKRRLSNLLPAKPDMGLPGPLESRLPPMARSCSDQYSNTRTASAAPQGAPDCRPQGGTDPVAVSGLGERAATQERRESAMTEFEEDGPTGNATRAESAKAVPSALPSSASVSHRCDEDTNWAVENATTSEELVEVDALPDQTAALCPAASVSVALGPAVFKPTRELEQRFASLPRPIQATSPENLQAASHSDPCCSPSDANAPRPLFSYCPGHRASRHIPRSANVPNKPRADSADSGVTTFSTSSKDDAVVGDPSATSAPAPTTEPRQAVHLSPLIESPNSGSRRSPTTYPKMRQRLFQPAASTTSRRVSSSGRIPPSSRRSFMDSYGPASAYMPAHASPNVGLLDRPPRSRPPLGHAAPIMALPRLDDRRHLPSAHYECFRPSRPLTAWPAAPQPVPYRGIEPPHRHRPNRYSIVPEMQWRPPQYLPSRDSSHLARRHGPYQQSGKPAAAAPSPLARNPSSQSPAPSWPVRSAASSASTSSNSHSHSSLLAKRLGSRTAANMTIPTDRLTRAKANWQRADHAAAVTAAPSPSEAALASGPGQLQPAWMTPTRRGGHLYLNIQ